MMLIGFASSYLNLIVGICQANVLTQVSIQLNSLFNYTKQLVEVIHLPPNTEMRYRDNLQKRQKCNNIFTCVLIVILCLGYIIQMIIFHAKITKMDKCRPEYDPYVYSIFHPYFLAKTFATALVDIWLFTVTIITLKMIKSDETTDLKFE